MTMTTSITAERTQWAARITARCACDAEVSHA
jgi:hypothetical protein